MTLWVGVVLCVGAYLAGSFCLGHVLAARAGVDLRSVGSGNVGATNVARALGPAAGRWVMLADVAKGALPVAIARVLGLEGAWVAGIGFAAAIGHVLPVWHRFRGGKAVATAIGVLLAASPWSGLAAAATFFAVKAATRRASVASLAAMFIANIVLWTLHSTEPRSILGVALFALVAIRHVDNVRRLGRGEEPAA